MGRGESGDELGSKTDAMDDEHGDAHLVDRGERDERRRANEHEGDCDEQGANGSDENWRDFLVAHVAPNRRAHRIDSSIDNEHDTCN